MSGSWGCPHEVRGQCNKVPGEACDPGMKGCVLYGKVVFTDPEKNTPAIRKKVEEEKRAREAVKAAKKKEP